MAILARHLRGRDQLPGDKLVATVMSNLGFKIAMQNLGVQALETQVGDRYVLEQMRVSGAGVAGEQSGHVILAATPRATASSRGCGSSRWWRPPVRR